MGSEPYALDDIVGQGSQQETDAEYNALLAQATGQAAPTETTPPVASPPRGWQAAGQYVWEGIQRNFRQLEAAPQALTAVYHGLTGDPVAEMLAAAEAQETERKAPQPRWSLQDVTGAEDFGYWAAERFGENALTLLTAFAGGASGALIGGLGARALGGSAAARLAAQKAGALSGAFATSAPIETAGTAGEQFEVTGSTQPQLSLPAGVAKGLLELWTPSRVINAMLTPGRQLGRTVAGAAVGAAGREAATEAAQEAIDIAARMYNDPQYSFFGQGPTLSMGPGAWRLLESATAGGLIGGAVGGITGAVEARQERRSPEGGLLPGEIEPVQEGQAPPVSEVIPVTDGPPTALGGPPNVDAAIRGWQGSPHSFTQHDISKVGTGEGAAAYGHGHYFGGAQKVGEHYQVTTAKQMYDGREYNGSPEDIAGRALSVSQGKRTAAENYIKGLLRHPTLQDQKSIEKNTAALQVLKEGRESKITEEANLYEVDLDVEPGELLDWDKLLSEQPPGVLAKIQPLIATAVAVGKTAAAGGELKSDPTTMTGGDVYRQLGTKKMASAEMLAVGVPGLQYLDADSRLLTGEEQTRNYVMFGDDKIKIVSKNGVPVTQASVRVYSKDAAPRQQPEQPVVRTPSGEEPGPITVLRGVVERGQSKHDVSLSEATLPLPQDDLLSVSALLRAGVPPSNMDVYLDFVEASTPRYLLEESDGSFGNGVLTDTDLEYATAKLPQNEKPRVYQVDQGSLIPAAITAMVDELPAGSSRRVWFLPGVTPEEQVALLYEYEALRASVEQNRWNLLASEATRKTMLDTYRPMYDKLLSQGLRVIPNRGASFLYMGGAPLRADAVEVPASTGRAKQWLFLTYEGALYTGARYDNEVLSSQFAASTPGAVPVTMDLNKFKPGEISILPMRFEDGKTQFFQYTGLTIPKGGSLRETQEAHRARVESLVPPVGQPWTQENLQKFREFMKQGIYIDPTSVDYASALITRDPVDRTKLVAGVNFTELQGTSVVAAMQTKPPALKEGKKTLLALSRPNALPSERETARRLEVSLKRWMPAMERILASFGMERQIQLSIQSMSLLPPAEQMGDGTYAAAWYPRGTIEFYPGNQWSDVLDPQFDSKVWNVLAHEVGHMLAAQYFSVLPVEVKQQLVFAYNKMLLTRRTDSTAHAAKVDMTLDATRFYNTDYFSSMSEWHAEQFRRFMAKDLLARGEVESLYAEGARQLDRYYAAVEEQFPGTAAVNLLSPDFFFSAYMEYLRDYGKAKQRIRQLERQQAIYAVDEDIYASPMLTQVMTQVMKALQSMEHMFPKEHPFHLLFNPRLQSKIAPVEPGAIARTITGLQDKVIMELAVGSLQRISPEGVYEVFAHELIHVYKHLNLITREEMNVLYTSAVRDQRTLSPSEKASLRGAVEAEGVRKGWSPQKVEEVYQDVLREETVAYYVGSYARQGAARPEAKPLLERILEVIKRVAAALMDANYLSRDQILEAFFRGEMITRAERAELNETIIQRFMRTLFVPEQIAWDEIKSVDERYEARIEKNRDANGELNFATYQYFDKQTGKIVGQQEVNIRPGRGFNVHMQFSDAKGMAFHWLKFVEQDLGLPLLAPQVFSAAGLRAASRVYPDVKKYYVETTDAGGSPLYVSPKYAREQFDRWRRITRTHAEMKANGQTVAGGQVRQAIQQRNMYARLVQKVPKDIWTTNKHLLDQMFMLERNYHRDEVQGSMIRSSVQTEEAKLHSILEEAQGEHNTTDVLQMDFQRAMQDSQGDAAAKLGLRFDEAAPQDITVRNMRRIIAWADRTGAKTDPRYVRYLKRVGHDAMVSQEADRIGWFSKMYWGLRQLIWRNEHLTGLQVYGQRVEQYSAVITSWHRDADDIARLWEQKVADPKMRERFNAFMYWLTEMKYRSPTEVAAGTVRHPDRTELEGELRRRTLNVPQITDLNTGLLWHLYQPPWMVGTIAVPNSIFARFLDAVEQVSVANIVATVSSPTLRANAILDVQNEMNELRAKPYFPITRFGQHSITVRDGDPANNNRVLWFSTYESPAKRDQALAEVARRFPTDHIHKGRVPEEFLEFLGLPGPLIREVRNNMPNITAAQIAWLEELERQNLPDKAFRSRWLPGTGVQGHSMDAFRSFAHYFMHGSRYLARMQYRNPMSQAIASVEATIPPLPNSVKRRMIVDYMKKHYNYLMEGGRDWAKFKALVSLLQLGFSPAAALMNLTQTPMVSLPWIQGVFGTSQGQLTKSIRAVKGLRRGSVASGVGNYVSAREEMVRQGRIDIGQAAELGAYAEGSNLLGLLAGTTRQKMYRDFAWAGMLMFQKAEQANREVLFHAVWELGHKQFATNKRIKEIEANYFQEIIELQNRARMSYNDAVVFVLAKEALDQTQGLYAPYARPTFMRKPLAGTLLIFYQFVQMMMYAFFYNPGKIQMWLMMAFVYGAMGVPGSEDFVKLIRAVSVMLLGKDFDIELQARKMVREISRGTIFDEVGPDLFLHGLSRYGFGLGLLPDGYGIGQFDASANGSMGRLVPGLADAAHGISTAKKGEQIVSDVMQRLAGAGFGWFFNLVQSAAQGPGTVDGHRWEQMLPRTLRAAAAGYRYLPESLPTLGPLRPAGGATLPSGARIVQFNPSDPEDVAAIVGQFMGFRPTRVTEAMEARRAQVEAQAIYQARRGALMVQLDAAVQANSASTQETVLAAIVKYNEEVAREGRGYLAITNQQLRQSLQNRTRNRLLQEEFLPNQRMYQPLSQEMLDLFPGVKPQSVR